MAAPANRPCEPFAEISDLCCDALVDGDECRAGVDPAVLNTWIDVATDLLWAATGRRFGICEMTYRPCVPNCSACGRSRFSAHSWEPSAWTFPSTPLRSGGRWVNCWADDCDDCCTVSCSLDLPRGPVAEIVEIKVDGVPLPASAYRVDDWRELVRLDGECFPTCQSMDLDDSEVGTWSIRYRYGRPVPAALRAAVATYACELAKSCYELECQLPQRVQTISRQGVTVAMLDPQDFIEDGRTGLYLVDQVIKRYNPAGIQSRARVFRPDARRTRNRRTRT